MTAFLTNITLEQLQITVLKQWHDLIKTVIFLKQNYECIFKAPMNGFYDLKPEIHVVRNFVE